MGIIGEALHRAEMIEPALGDQLPEMRQIVGMRKRIIHGYDAMDSNVVWDAVLNNLSLLQLRLIELLGKDDPR